MVLDIEEAHICTCAADGLSDLLALSGTAEQSGEVDNWDFLFGGIAWFRVQDITKHWTISSMELKFVACRSFSHSSRRHVWICSRVGSLYASKSILMCYLVSVSWAILRLIGGRRITVNIALSVS